MSIQTVTLNQTIYGVPPVVHAVQNDTGRELIMILGDQTVDASWTADLAFERSDESFYSVSATLDVSTNSFSADITQALTQAGITRAQLKVTASNEVVSTYTFKIDVQEDVSGTVTPQQGKSIEEAIEEALEATGAFVEEQVIGTDPVIQAEINHRYICGEVDTLSFTPPAGGIVAIVFESGETPTVLTLPATVLMPEWYEVEANTINEINISDGVYGAVMVWPRE